MPQVLVGLTGLYCSGKNYAAALLEKRGIPVLDVDKLGHTAIESEKAAIVNRFGRDILTEDGSINRLILGKKVFADPRKLADLEAIVHPAANALTEKWLEAQTGGKPSGLCVINAALLHRSSVFDRLDAIILVKAPFIVRFFRALKRDNLPVMELFRRFFHQKKFTSKYFAINADIHIIDNSGFRDSSNLEKRLDTILEQCRICAPESSDTRK